MIERVVGMAQNAQLLSLHMRLRLQKSTLVLQTDLRDLGDKMVGYFFAISQLASQRIRALSCVAQGGLTSGQLIAHVTLLNCTHAVPCNLPQSMCSFFMFNKAMHNSVKAGFFLIKWGVVWDVSYILCHSRLLLVEGALLQSFHLHSQLLRLGPSGSMKRLRIIACGSKPRRATCGGYAALMPLRVCRVLS